MVKDLSEILAEWPSGPDVTRVRQFTAGDGRTFLQVRVDLGLLQMAIDGRPDGERPAGYESLLECLRDQVRQYAEPLNIAPAEWQALIREVLQYYRRRVSLITLARQAQREGNRELAMNCYRLAVRDADHNLAILDFLRDQCTSIEFVESQEPYRPFILMQRASCLAEFALLTDDADSAIEHLKSAVAQIEACGLRTVQDDSGESEEMDVRIFIRELRRLERRIRRKYQCRRTLREQLDDALAAEDYEQAARLRDDLNARAGERKNA